MKFKGKAWKFGDNVYTDVIIPARYLNVSDPQELAKHCMEDIDSQFASKVETGDVIVGGRNFGSGSSREHAPLAIKTCGVSCVIAASFARIFLRNAINIGLPVLECEQAAREVQQGDVLQIDLTRGTIEDLTIGKTFRAKPYPPFMLALVNAGGLVPYVRKNYGELAGKS